MFRSGYVNRSTCTPGKVVGSSDKGWRDGCSSKGQGFSSQLPYSESQLLVILVQGICCPLLTAIGTRHTHGEHIHMETK